MHIYIYTYIYIYTHIYIHIHTHTHTSEYTSVASAVQKGEPSRERLVKVYACIEIARFRLSASTLHPSPFTQKKNPGGFSPFLRRQANFWRCSCHMFVVLLKRPRLKLPTSLRCWKGKSVQPRLPVWIARYIGP